MPTFGLDFHNDVSRLCPGPFAQRTWIALIEKQVPYTKADIDLRNESGENPMCCKYASWSHAYSSNSGYD